MKGQTLHSVSSMGTDTTWYKVIVSFGDETKGGSDANRQFIVQADGRRHAVLRVLDEYDSENFYRVAVFPLDNTQIVI